MNRQISILVFALMVTVLLPKTSFAQEHDSAYVQKSNEAGSLCNQATGLAANHNYDQALVLYQKACDLDSNRNSASVHTNFGILLENMDRLDESVAEFNKALQFDPNQSSAKTGLVSSLCALGVKLSKANKYTEAKAVLEKAITIEPLAPNDAANVHTSYAVLLGKMGQIEDALVQYKIALDYDPQSKAAIYNIGCCYEQMGDLSQARKYLTKYVNDYPSEPNRNTVLITLETLKNKKSLFNENKDTEDYFKSTIAEGIALWPRSRMPLKVFIANGENIPGFRKSFSDILVWSFGQWLNAARNYLSFSLVSSEEPADIVCSWTNNVKDLHYGAEQGETLINFKAVRGGKPALTHASLKLCIVDPLTNEVLSDKVFTELCLHEIGHALGIKGHSPNRNDVMFFASGEIFLLHALSARDIATINRLYMTYQSN